MAQVFTGAAYYADHMEERKKRLLLITCPAGHQISPAVMREELTEAVRVNKFEYFCIFCGSNYTSPSEVIGGLKAMLSHWERELEGYRRNRLACFSTPETFKSRRIGCRVADGVLDVTVAEVVLDEPGICALIR